MSQAGERTEKPTARRLKDARKKGQVPRSRNMGAAASLAAAVFALGWAGRALVDGLGRATEEGLVRMGELATTTITAGSLVSLATSQSWILLQLIAPVAFAVILSTIAVDTLQGGWVFAPSALAVDWSKLSPVNGLKRLGFSQAGVESLKMLVSVTALTLVSYAIVQHSLTDSVRWARLPTLQAAAVGWADAERLFKQVALVLFVVAIADYGVQRWRFTSSLKMTKQEVKEDNKMTEGNPETKARVRRIQRDMFRRRMLASMTQATFVVTNPTHFAVALQYERGLMPAPRVVAKGKNLLALRIREIARDKEIPIVENPPLAQALYKTVEVGDTIPAALFEAVAEVLAYLIRLKQLALR